MNTWQKLVAVVFTPILFDNGTDEAAFQQKAVQRFIEAGCRNWAVDVEWVLFFRDPRVVQAMLDTLPGDIYLKLGNCYPSSWFTEAGKTPPAGDYFKIKLWEEWMSPYIARDLEKAINLFGGRVKAVECGLEYSVQALWPHEPEKYWLEIQPALIQACQRTGVKPILFNDTIHGDSINKTSSNWKKQIKRFFEVGLPSTLPVGWELGIHLYRATGKNDWPEKYEIVKDYIRELGYEYLINITETGYDAYKDSLCGIVDMLREQAACWDKHLDFTVTEYSIGMTWMYCYWLNKDHQKEHAVLGPYGAIRPAFNAIKPYW